MIISVFSEQHLERPLVLATSPDASPASWLFEAVALHPCQDSLRLLERLWGAISFLSSFVEASWDSLGITSLLLRARVRRESEVYWTKVANPYRTGSYPESRITSAALHPRELRHKENFLAKIARLKMPELLWLDRKRHGWKWVTHALRARTGTATHASRSPAVNGVSKAVRSSERGTHAFAAPTRIRKRLGAASAPYAYGA